MERFNGFKAEKAIATAEQLPVDAYVCKIIGAKEEKYQWGSVLVIAFDIAEGAYKNFYDTQFKNSTVENKKWKGTYRVTVPVEGSQYFDSNLRKFNNVMWAIEDSNKGYTWNWNESSLKGKSVGILMRNEEWQMEDRSGWSTRPFMVMSTNDVKNGKYKIPADKPLKDKPTMTPSAVATTPYHDVEEIGGDIPF